MKTRIFSLAAGLVCLLLVLPVRSAEVTVFAAASLAEALQDIAAHYEHESGVKIIFNFGASSTLARQIEEGAPADIFFSADEAKMDGLEKKGLVEPGTRLSLLGNSLVVVVATNSPLPIHSARDLTNAAVKRIALADPQAVPAGIYAKKWLEKCRIWPAVEPKVVPMENVRAALAAVASENVEAGVVYKTDAHISKKVMVAYEVPLSDAPDISYPVAAIKPAGNPDSAQKFIRYLNSDSAARIYAQYGFLIRQPGHLP